MSSAPLLPTNIGLGSATEAVAQLPNSLPIPKVELPSIQSDSNIFSKRFVVGLIIYSLVGIPAAILSYRCSSALEYNTFLKVLYSVGAFFGGVAYVIYYIFFRSDLCKHCVRKNKSPKPLSI